MSSAKWRPFFSASLCLVTNLEVCGKHGEVNNQISRHEVLTLRIQLVASRKYNSEACYTEWDSSMKSAFCVAVVISTWASFQIRKVVGCACAGNAGNIFPRDRLQRKPLVSDPNMHHGTCITHLPWCMSGSLTRGRGKTFPAFPAHAHPQFYVSGKRPIMWTLQLYVYIDSIGVRYRFVYALNQWETTLQGTQYSGM